jgi:hypothetical protein
MRMPAEFYIEVNGNRQSVSARELGQGALGLGVITALSSAANRGTTRVVSDTKQDKYLVIMQQSSYDIPFLYIAQRTNTRMLCQHGAISPTKDDAGAGAASLL